MLPPRLPRLADGWGYKSSPGRSRAADESSDNRIVLVGDRVSVCAVIGERWRAATAAVVAAAALRGRAAGGVMAQRTCCSQ